METVFSKCDEATGLLKLLSNPNRLMVLCCLLERRYNVTELSQKLNIPQTALSNQLTILREAEIVDCEINHRERLYFITDPRVEKIIHLLHSFFCENDENHC